MSANHVRDGSSQMCRGRGCTADVVGGAGRGFGFCRGRGVDLVGRGSSDLVGRGAADEVGEQIWWGEGCRCVVGRSAGVVGGGGVDRVGGTIAARR